VVAVGNAPYEGIREKGQRSAVGWYLPIYLEGHCVKVCMRVVIYTHGGGDG
jgi:hypothetical protein